MRLTRIAWLRISVILALLAGFALSPKLWLSTRLYPLTPLWSFVRPFPSPVDSILFFTLIGLFIAAAVVPRRGILIAVFVLLGAIAVQDQSRWQPWFYQYVLMLGALALAGTKRDRAALNTCCLIVAATYIWSGLSKVNPVFVDKTFPWLVQPFMGWVPAGAQGFVRSLALAAPAFELAAGIGLLIRRFRFLALFSAIAMHVFVLAALGPLGRNSNPVVWPWNLAMIAFLLILFFIRTDHPGAREIIWERGFPFQKIVLLFSR
ncbi:MAG TPA: hypothetical protein VH157_03865 [Bryobacteraceae bacterium]|nr:hypothetical protein [Bryobacteraceae bacterium]